jgi:5-deoxy-glucuronate isomerase
LAPPRLLFRSSTPRPDRTRTVIDVSPARVGWKYVQFAVHRIVPAQPWTSRTGRHECCLVLLRGTCSVEYTSSDGDRRIATLGPRRDVFSGYPHAIYLPPRTRIQVTASEPTELADGRAPARTEHPPRVIAPADCGFEIRGGGNATRQIVDIMPPAFPADRLLVCEVYTPAGNWSSCPPHKHDVDRPPGEVKLEEIYYYRFADPDAYGFQRLYDGRDDRTVTVQHGDLVVVRRGYHPFVTAYGYNSYYLNVLAGTRRSMAASDDPRYAAFRRWPAPDPRVPLVPPPAGVVPPRT